MKVTRWGTQLAICLPDEVIDTLQLQEGDEVAVNIARVNVMKDQAARKLVLDRIAELRTPLPAGFKFDREDANMR